MPASATRRRSSRLASSSKQVHLEDKDSDDEKEESLRGAQPVDADNANQRVAKRSRRSKPAATTTKKSKPVARRQKGKLANLPQMPLDILFEVFKLLEPLDLLRLARTTKALRAILMNRSALTVWKSARANVPDLPDCPEGIAEPVFANFMYTNNCSQCLSPRASNDFPPYFVRYCKRCVQDKVLWGAAYNGRSLAAFSQKIGHSVAYTYVVAPSHGQSKLAWLTVEFERAVEQFRSYENSDEGWSNFIEARKKVLETDRLWHVAYSEWVFNKVDKRAGELEQIRTNRLSAIKDKLSQLGWDDTLTAMISSEHSQLMGHPLVKQPRPLTDRAWTKIEADVVNLMHVFKANRMARAHAQIVSDRRKLLTQAVTNWKNTQPVSAIVPSPADLLEMEDLQPLNARIENDPNDVEFTLETFAEFSTQLPDLCAKWISKATDILLGICKSTLCLRPVTRDTLSLVTSVFVCAECGGVVSYPAVLTHFCFTKPHARFYDPEDIYDLILEGDSYNTPWMKVAPQSLLWLGHLNNSLAPLIRSCGFDPQTTTHDQLDEENVIIRFTDIYGGSDIMGWRSAVRTVAEHGLHDGEWTRETDQEVLDAIPQLELDFYRFECAVVVCVHCRDSLIALALPAHMKRHKEDQPISRSDFWVHPDNPLEALFRIPREDALSDSDDDDLLIYPASSEYE